MKKRKRQKKIEKDQKRENLKRKKRISNINQHPWLYSSNWPGSHDPDFQHDNARKTLRAPNLGVKLYILFPCLIAPIEKTFGSVLNKDLPPLPAKKCAVEVCLRVNKKMIFSPKHMTRCFGRKC